MREASGFITAGGKSSRMGEDKAWLDLGGKPMICRAIDLLRPITADLSIIANGERYQTLGLPVYSDTNQDVGPLEAIRTALVHSTHELAILLGCDLPLVRPSLFELLLSLSEGFQAVVPVGADGQLETLCAVYSRGALEAVTHLIAGGGRMVRLLFELMPTRVVEFDELRSLDGASLFFENVNTPDDYFRVRQLTQGFES